MSFQFLSTDATAYPAFEAADKGTMRVKYHDAYMNSLELALSNKFTFVDTSIGAETTRAVGAEGALQTAIDTEAARALAAEGALQTGVDAEVARATAAEGALQTALDGEAAGRVAVDAALQTAIDAEVTRATAVDIAHDAAIAAEVTARTAADDALQTQINGLTGLNALTFVGNLDLTDAAVVTAAEASVAGSVYQVAGAAIAATGFTYGGVVYYNGDLMAKTAAGPFVKFDPNDSVVEGGNAMTVTPAGQTYRVDISDAVKLAVNTRLADIQTMLTSMDTFLARVSSNIVWADPANEAYVNQTLLPNLTAVFEV